MLFPSSGLPGASAPGFPDDITKKIMTKKFVKFIRNTAGIGYGYMEGQEVEFNESLADEFIELGVAIGLKKTSGLPADFPGLRVLSENGFTTIEQIRKIGTVEQLVEIKGIGKKLAESIVERLK